MLTYCRNTACLFSWYTVYALAAVYAVLATLIVR